MRIALGQINSIIGNLPYNFDKIIEMIHKAKSEKMDLVLFPEMCLTGYPPEDFLLLPDFIESAAKKLEEIIPHTEGITAVIGLPRKNSDGMGKPLYNSAAILHDGRLLGFQDKSLLPTYDVFDEQRYFEPCRKTHIWEIKGKRLAVTICEDIWQHSALVKETTYHHDPIADLKNQKPDILLNLSASPFALGKMSIRMRAGSTVAKALKCSVYHCNLVGGNDSLIFDGRSYVCDPEGKFTGIARAFSEDFFIPSGQNLQLPEEVELLEEALALGIKDYFHKQGFKQACLGLSGGIDSAVVACVAVKALGAANVVGVSMPSRYTSASSKQDAAELANNLGIKLIEIPIEQPFESFLDLLAPEFKGFNPDTTEENLQSRIRGMLLMALSNKKGYIILSTGNKSEMAMGYTTLYGDLCGGLAVLSDVTKKNVYALAKWINRDKTIIPVSTITKAPSAELRPNQKDSDSLPEYDIVDQVVHLYVEEHLPVKEIIAKTGFKPELVQDLIQRIHRNEYKRRQSPPGLRVSSKAFTVGRKFPIVQGWV